MKKQALILFLILLFVGGQKIAGQILYTDLIPDAYTTCLPVYRGDSIQVDVNQDGQNDFVVISNSHFNYIHGNCCDCYKNEILGLAPLNQIARDTVYDEQTCGRIFLDTGICVGSNYQYQINSTFSSAGPCGLCGPSGNILKYFPFQVEINGNVCYGWFRILHNYSSITLYDLAVNLTPNECIKTGQTTTAVLEIGRQSDFSLFPNPTNGSFEIQFNKTILKGRVQIVNTIGKVVFEKEIYLTPKINFSLNDLNAGIYFVKVIGEELYTSKKIVIE